MVKIESEFDFGYGDTIFRTKEEAINTLRNDPNVRDVCKDNQRSLDQLIGEGLISFQNLLLG